MSRKMKTLNEINPISEGEVRAKYMMFGSHALSELENNGRLMEYRRFFPGYELIPVPGKEGGMVMSHLATVANVSVLTGKSRSKIASKASQTLVAYPLGNQVMYRAIELLNVADGLFDAWSNLEQKHIVPALFALLEETLGTTFINEHVLPIINEGIAAAKMEKADIAARKTAAKMSLSEEE